MALFAVNILLMLAVGCWTGAQATDPVNCKAIYDADSSSTDGSYTINPDGDGGLDPFEVQCNMTSGGVTVIHHNYEMYTDVPPGYEEAGSWHVPISYTHTMEQMTAIADVSTKCKQKVSLKCNGVQIWKDIDGVRTQHSCWNNRDGAMRNNWGANDGTDGCKCADDNSCINGGDCNCDSEQETEDGGSLNNKDDLPVSKLQFGDTGDDGESSSYRMGPLKCT